MQFFGIQRNRKQSNHQSRDGLTTDEPDKKESQSSRDFKVRSKDVSSTDGNCSEKVGLTSGEEQDDRSQSELNTTPQETDGEIATTNLGQSPIDTTNSLDDRETGKINGPETRRKPQQAGGRRNRTVAKPSSGSRQAPRPRPELTCKLNPSTLQWEVIVSSADECRITEVQLDEKPLEVKDQQCTLESLSGCLTVSCDTGQVYEPPLFNGKEPLVFKLQKDWSGIGRRISKITIGHFIVFAPVDWERTGHVPLEPEGCADESFLAHYFYRDAPTTSAEIGGFKEEVKLLGSDSIQLSGARVYDDSDEGDLFVETQPNLASSILFQWARAGLEDANDWKGQSFQPTRATLKEILNGLEGRFFLRVYDQEVKLVDSAAFRYSRNLKRILVNGIEYVKDMVIVPTLEGYSPTNIQFEGKDEPFLRPDLPEDARQFVHSSGLLRVPPQPDADCVECFFGSGDQQVRIKLDLPRLWWRMERESSDLGEWQDTPIAMTREEFKEFANTDAKLSILSRRFSSVRVGFADELEREYKRTLNESTIEIPMFDFDGYNEIEQRLYSDTHLNIECRGKLIALITVTADPVPEIVSFSAGSTSITPGLETKLTWTTRNGENARVEILPEVGVVDLCGTTSVRPNETTNYVITVVQQEVEVSDSVEIRVQTPASTNESTKSLVKRGVYGWRIGKGFSLKELQQASMTMEEARIRRISIDKRRRTMHLTNVEKIRS